MSTLVLLPGVFWGLPSGKFVVGAGVILDGGIPYRDFWTMYAPGSFYLVASLFAVFGKELLIQAMASVLLRAAAGGVFFLLLRRVGSSRGLALLLTGLFVGMLWQTAPELDTYPPVLLLFLLGLGRMLRYFEGGGVRPLLQAGVLCGVGAWFKHDVAAYVAAAFVVSLFVAWGAVGTRRPGAWLSPLRALSWLAASAVLLVVPGALLLAWGVGRDAWQDLIVFPATVFAKVFGEPYPPLYPDFFGAFAVWLDDPSRLSRGRFAFEMASAWILGNVPQWVFIAGMVAVFRCRQRLQVPTLSAAVLMLSLLPFFWAAAHVQKNTHLYSMAVLSMLLGAMAWQGVGAETGRLGARSAIVACAALYGAGLLIPSAMDMFFSASQLGRSRPLGLPGTAGIRVSEAEYEVYRPIAEFVRGRVPSGEPIYVGVKRHDAIVITNMRFYYLTGRRGASPYYELHPGIADDARTQERVIRSIEEKGVRCAVLWRFGWRDTLLDEIKARRMAAFEGLGARALDEYLASAFEPVASHGEYVVLWRRGARAGPLASAAMHR